MASTAEHDAMRRALTLAANGPRGVNPQVGALLLGEVVVEAVDDEHRHEPEGDRDQQDQRDSEARLEGSRAEIADPACE